MKRFPNLDFLIPLAFDAGASLLRLRHFSQFDVKAGGGPEIPAMDAVIDLVVGRTIRHFPHVSVVAEYDKRIVFGSGVALFVGSLGDIPSIERLPTLSLATVVDGVPEAAVIYAPAGGHLWTARKGSGCRSDGKPVSVSERGTFDGSSFYVSSADIPKSEKKLLGGLKSLDASIVDVGPAAYMGGMIASGMFEGAVFPMRRSPEAPAIRLIVEEAGGVFSDVHGSGDLRHGHGLDPWSEDGWYVASNGTLHDDLLYLVRASNGP